MMPLSMAENGRIEGVILGGLATVGMLIWIVISILNIIGCWKIYSKFGEPGWKCLIPFYNTISTSGIRKWRSLVLVRASISETQPNKKENSL